jgi:hypothetical protein
MAADIKVESFAARLDASTVVNGTEDFTVSGFGTVKGVIIIGTQSVNFNSNNTGSQTSQIAFFANNGETNSGGSSSQSAGVVNNFTATSVTARGMNSGAYHYRTAATWTQIGFYSIDSFITDGVRLKCFDRIPADFLITLIFIGGADVDCYCGFIDDLGTSATTTNVTDPGWEPDLVLTHHVGHTARGPTGTAHNIHALGAMLNDGLDTQRMMGWFDQDNLSTTNTGSYFADNLLTAQYFNNALSWEGTGAFLSTGFSITTNASASSDIVNYLALRFRNGAEASLFDVTIPTSGNYVETGPGHTPIFGMICHGVGVNTANTSVDGYGIGITTLCGTREDTTAWSSRDNNSQTDLRNYVGRGISNIDPTNSGTEYSSSASAYSLDANGWTFTMDSNPAAATLGFGISITDVGDLGSNLDSVGDSIGDSVGDSVGAGLEVSPSGIQRLGESYMPIAASEINGVIQ